MPIPPAKHLACAFCLTKWSVNVIHDLRDSVAVTLGALDGEWDDVTDEQLIYILNYVINANWPVSTGAIEGLPVVHEPLWSYA